MQTDERTVELSAFPPAEQPEGKLIVDGFEPWNVEAILKARRQPTDNKFLPTGKIFVEKGLAAVPKEARAFWYSYYAGMKKMPLPKKMGAEVEALGKDDLQNMSIGWGDAHPDLKTFAEAAEKTEQSLVFRFGDVGLFASRAGIRMPTLPDWCIGAVIVNTKAKTWECVACGPPGKAGIPQLVLWVSGAKLKEETGQIWVGNRCRVKATGLPPVSEAIYALRALSVVLK